MIEDYFPHIVDLTANGYLAQEKRSLLVMDALELEDALRGALVLSPQEREHYKAQRKKEAQDRRIREARWGYVTENGGLLVHHNGLLVQCRGRIWDFIYGNPKTKK